jgi:hypothetical protein
VCQASASGWRQRTWALTLECHDTRPIGGITRAGRPSWTPDALARLPRRLRETFRFYLRHADRFLTTIADEIGATIDDPLERVRRFAIEVIRREFVHPGERLIRAEHEMLLFASTDAELAAHVRAWDTRWAGHLAGDLEAAGRPRAIETARTILNLIRGYELERLLDPRPADDAFERRIDAVLARPGPAARTARDRRAS